ncbi:MAG: hypothetical protein JZU64_04130 [Rhodoferax sp.]|jgi:hypothetical protein|nr:hypothetical protein [Rhodoferax sp.]
MNANRLRRQLAYQMRRLGWPGVCGLVLTLAAVAGAISLQWLTSARIDLLERQTAQSAARLKQLQQAPATHQPGTPTMRLLAFYAEFPKGATVPDWLEKIYAIAAEQQLTLDAGEYSLTRASSGRLDQFRIVLPVKASYPQLRKFISAALASAPALALESLTLKRNNVAEGSVEAQIVFLLYLEKGA